MSSPRLPPPPPEALLVEDCPVLLAAPDGPSARAVADALLHEHIGFLRARTEAEAEALLDSHEFEVVVLAVDLDPAHSSALTERLRQLTPELSIVALLDAATPSDAMRELAVDAWGCISQPVHRDGALDVIQRALQASHRSQTRPPTTPLSSLKEVQVRSAAMRSVMALLERVATTDATVMIRGESGTGKEVVARRLHELSGRAGGPLVKVHCAALPEQLLESELFGYERGAFTGAHARKPGRVELAERGTLFLDEIGEISMSVQVKLLRLLQDREYERLGGTRTLPADVRFVTATHRNLEQMVRRGAFREDLYYRLNVVRLDLPPLRDRRDDIEPLARHFCRQTSAQTGRNVELTPGAMARVVQGTWRGNVRELQNVIERLVVLSEGSSVSEKDVILEQEHALGPTGVGDLGVESSVTSLDVALRRAEQQALEKALRKAGGNRALAARILGVSRRALFYKLREYDLK
jgi:two-component system response regulator AtoC